MPGQNRTERIGPLVLTLKGQIPTIPKVLGLDSSSKNFLNTDLLDGEYAINNIDHLFFYRIKDKIYTLDIDYIYNNIDIFNEFIKNHSDPIVTQISGTRYIIPVNVIETIKNNYQYFIKDHLYLTGGHIVMEGNAQLVIH